MNGAIFKVFQVSSGSAPSFKPRVDVVLEGPHDCFHSSKLLRNYLHLIPKGKKKVVCFECQKKFPKKEDLLNNIK